MKNNEGMSEVIGVILMVAITVAIAATVYVYVSDMLETQADVETEIELLIRDKFIFTDGYQLFSINVNELNDNGLYSVDLKLLNGDEPIRQIFDLLINIETDKFYFSEDTEFLELRN